MTINKRGSEPGKGTAGGTLYNVDNGGQVCKVWIENIRCTQNLVSISAREICIIYKSPPRDARPILPW